MGAGSRLFIRFLDLREWGHGMNLNCERVLMGGDYIDANEASKCVELRPIAAAGGVNGGQGSGGAGGESVGRQHAVDRTIV